MIENLDGLTNLKSIFLGKNKITKLQNLDSLINLEILGVQVSESVWYSVNGIYQEFLTGINSVIHHDCFPVAVCVLIFHWVFLTCTSFYFIILIFPQSNRIIKLDGLGRLVNLEQLYCSHNGIEVLEGLDNNVRLQTLDMAVNRIKKIENVSHLTELEEFWVSEMEYVWFVDAYGFQFTIHV